MSQDQNTTALVKADEKSVRYIPFGAKDQIELSIGMVKRFLATPTKSGKTPDDREIVKFMMLCQARELNPWESDAYLVGFDSHDGPQFSMITAHQAFLKRAEACPEYDGMESGVIVKNPGGELDELFGDFVPANYILMGGWAKVYRKDRRIPTVSRLNRSVYDKQYSRWKVDPAGMIVKCAEADALRRTFPNKLSHLYVEGEREPVGEYAEVPPINGKNNNSGKKAAALKDELKKRAEKEQPLMQPPVNGDEPENGEVIETVTGEVIPETSELQEKSDAPYPDDWQERHKVEKPKGYAFTWNDRSATPKFLEKLRKEKVEEAAFEMRFRIDQQGVAIPKDEKLYDELTKLK